MTRETSCEAYRAISASGILGERQLEAWSLLRQHGPLTGQEVCRLGGNQHLDKRLSELRDAGLAVETGVRPCTVSGRHAVTFKAVLPTQLIKPVKRQPREFWVVIEKGMPVSITKRPATIVFDNQECVKVREVFKRPKHEARNK